MTQPPVFWGVGLAFALGGAIAGNAIGSTPITDRSTIAMFYQSHDTAAAEQPDRRALPDHYPLVTRSGVVPVAELSDRGLFSQARYRSFVAAAYEADAPQGYGAGFVEDAPALDTEVRSAGVTPEETAAPAPSLALAEGSGEGSEGARTIDVQAQLAIR